MGDYILGPDGELYHWGWKKEDHKYIKRERKNGKWVYTYPEDSSKTESKKVNPPISDRKKQVTAGRNLINLRGDSGKGTGPRTMSKEYEAELGYNSKTNEYPKPKMLPSQSVQKNASKETVSKATTENKKTETKKETNWLEEAKKKIDNLGDWASEKLKDVGDSIEDLVDDAGDFIDDAKDWVDDRADDLYDATIGEVKDAMGYDERAALYKAQEKLDTSKEYVMRGIEDLKIDLLMGHSYGFDDDIFRDKDYYLETIYEDYALADAEYTWAKAAYENTLLGKIDKWVNREKPNKEPSIDDGILRENIIRERIIPERVITEQTIPEQTIPEQVLEENRIVGRRLELDPFVVDKEAEYFVALMKLMSIEEYIHEYNPSKNSSVRSYSGRLAGDVQNAYDELESAVRYDEDFWDVHTGRNLELERVDRIYGDIEDMIGSAWRGTH